LKPSGTLFFSRGDVASLLDLDDCITAVESAFRLLGEGKIGPAGILGVASGEGGFHIKAAVLPTSSRQYFAAKINANFPGNPARRGLPAIQGAVLLCDAENGYPLAILDSIELTIRRTGAATAVAARHLAREDARTVAILGCGNQGRIQLEALTRVRRVERARAWDIDSEAARTFAVRMSGELRIPVEAVGGPGQAARGSDIVVTCTPSREPFLGTKDISPGTFVAAVGADNPGKQEIDPGLLASARLTVDSLEQCAEIGELHHALDAGLLSKSDVHAELSEIVAGRKAGRLSPEETTVFDSTGTAIQDVAAAAFVYEKGTSEHWHRLLNLAE
jgi:alanine dehydrogenase